MWRLVLLGLLLAACEPRYALDAGVGNDAQPPGPPFYQRCSGPCVRLSDCALSYPDDELCQPGFTCASDVPGCRGDAGTRD